MMEGDIKVESELSSKQAEVKDNVKGNSAGSQKEMSKAT